MNSTAIAFLAIGLLNSVINQFSRLGIGWQPFIFGELSDPLPRTASTAPMLWDSLDSCAILVQLLVHSSAEMERFMPVVAKRCGPTAGAAFLVVSIELGWCNTAQAGALTRGHRAD
jgi:hypothetical protein